MHLVSRLKPVIAIESLRQMHYHLSKDTEIVYHLDSQSWLSIELPE